MISKILDLLLVEQNIVALLGWGVAVILYIRLIKLTNMWERASNIIAANTEAFRVISSIFRLDMHEYMESVKRHDGHN